MSESFNETMKEAYGTRKNVFCIGCGVHDSRVNKDLTLNVSLKSLNRHGLISGATGTGKTKTVQMLAEQLATQGVPTLLMDMKGDLSGLAMAGLSNEAITKRQASLALDFKPRAYPTQFLALGSQAGIKIRTSLREFGSHLFARMLGVNDTQTSVINVLFHYAKDEGLLLIDLDDFKQLLNFAQGEGRKAMASDYGGMSVSSLQAILRRVIELEAQGGEELFGEPSFDIEDLMLKAPGGEGVISLLRLMAVQDNPKLFSTFMLGLLTSVYRHLPEIGDADKPRLVIFIDEAHLIFKNASQALLDKIETMVKLIRSKGVGLMFCTQSPKDIPDGVLSQLGLKIQHALRAFSAKDRKAIKLIAENFPLTNFYDTPALLTSLSIGEALVSALDEKGLPTPLVAAMIRAPLSRMGALSEAEFKQQISQCALVKKYHTRLDPESAKEILIARKKGAAAKEPASRSTKATDKQDSALTSLSKNTLFRQILRTLTREVTRAVMAVLGIKKSRRRKK